MEKLNYQITWSEEDKVFIATASQLPSLAAHGSTPVEALIELQGVISTVLSDTDDVEPPLL